MIDKDQAAITIINALRNELRAVLDFPATHRSDQWRKDAEMTIKTAEKFINRVTDCEVRYMDYEKEHIGRDI